MGKLRNALLGAACLPMIATAAHADGTISSASGNFTVGIGNNGELFDYNSYTGFRRNADGADPLSPGTPRDSWGVTTDLGSAFADQSYYGSGNLTGTTFTWAANSATASTTTNVGVKLDQSYSFVADNILRITETLTNVSDLSLSIMFAREWDTDPQPTFNNVSYGPIGANPMVLDASWYGFDDPRPFGSYGGTSCLPNCSVDGDNGGGIQIGLGTLAAGASRTFTYYYGIAQTGQDPNGLVAQAQGVGVNYLMMSASDDGGTNSQFIGLGSVPEPATWGMMLMGFGLAGMALRRQRTSVAFG